MALMSVQINGKSYPDNTKEWASFPVATDADMSNIEIIACVVTNGDGPTLWLQGALHGSEHVGALAIRDYLRDVDPADLDGTIIGVPVANPSAFATKQRLTAVDGRDVNRSFPGSENGYFSEMLANTLYTTAAEHADYFADFHNGGNEYDVPGFCIYSRTGDEVEEESIEMCRAADLPYAAGIDSEFGGSMGTEIINEGIPTAVVEVGGQGHISDGYYEQNRRAIDNIAKYIGVVDGDPDLTTEVAFYSKLDWHHASAGGFFEPAVEANSEVEEGDELAAVTNLKGEVLETFTAPYDGVVLCIRSYPMVRPGDWAIELAPESSRV